MGGTLRFWVGLRPFSQHLRACTMKWVTPPSATTSKNRRNMGYLHNNNNSNNNNNNNNNNTGNATR